MRKNLKEYCDQLRAFAQLDERERNRRTVGYIQQSRAHDCVGDLYFTCVNTSLVDMYNKAQKEIADLNLVHQAQALAVQNRLPPTPIPPLPRLPRNDILVVLARELYSVDCGWQSAYSKLMDVFAVDGAIYSVPPFVLEPAIVVDTETHIDMLIALDAHLK